MAMEVRLLLQAGIVNSLLLPYNRNNGIMLQQS